MVDIEVYIMNALVLEDIGTIKYKEVEKPIPQEGEVLVKVMACGVCGSDIPRSYKDGAHNMPLIIGHEFAGVVESVGDNVDAKWLKKPVGVFPLIPCNKCRPCLNRQYEMCKSYSYLGSRRDGGFAQYVSVPEWNLIELPQNVQMESAAMLEPMAVAVHAMRRVNIKPTDKIVVCGLGTIGILLTMFLLERNLSNIYVIGNKDFQKNMVTELGISKENYCDAKKESVYDFVMDKTDGAGADVFFECVGNNETVSLAVDCAAAAGSVCMVGNPRSDMNFTQNTYWKILRNQLTVTGTWNSSFYGDGDDWRYVLYRLTQKLIDPSRLITHRYELSEITEGLEIMRDKSEDYIKIMAYPNGK